MRTAWNFHSAGQLVFGRGATAQLGGLLARRKLSRAFLVTDPRLQAAGLVERVLQPLRTAQLVVEVFTGGEPEPAVGNGSGRSGSRPRSSARLHPGPGRRQQHGPGEDRRRPADAWRRAGEILRLRQRPRPGPAAGLRADDRRHRQRGLARRRADRHGEPDQGQHAQPVPAAGAGPRRSGPHRRLPPASDRRQRHRRADARDRGLHGDRLTTSSLRRMAAPVAYEGRYPLGAVPGRKGDRS